MSLVTKVFIVLQLVFSIALGTLAIVIAGQTHNWKELADQYQVKATTAETVRSQAQAQWGVERAQVADRLATQQGELLRRAETLSSLAAELDSTKSELARQQVKNSELGASLSEVSKSLEVELARAERLEARNNELLAMATDLRQRNLDLNERVKELTTNVTLLEQQVRAFQQQRFALEQQLSGLQRQLKRAGVSVITAEAVVEPSDTRTAPLVPQVAVPIRGHIEHIEGNIAQISVGSDDGVDPGMTFVIYRDGKYIGRIVVEEVDAGRSAGTLSHLQEQTKVGDKVADEARFEMVH